MQKTLTTGTSESHPIFADLVELPTQIQGKLGLTLAPGKKQPHSATGFNWQRDIDLDLETLQKNYSANVLLSLIRDTEYKRLQIEDLPSKTEARGIQFFKFPIQDGSTPESIEETVVIVEKMVQFLREGKSVIINCMGGLGRTGLLSACILLRLYQSLDMEITPEKAIQITRKARKGTVKSYRQVTFVENFWKQISNK